MKHLSYLLPFIVALLFSACTVSETKTPATETAKNNSEAESQTGNTIEKVVLSETKEEQNSITPNSSSALIPGLPTEQSNRNLTSEGSAESNAAQALVLLHDKLSPPKQEFAINADSIITIVGKQGTRIYIPAQSLMTADSQLVHGKVTIQLLECYDKASFFAHRLNTHTVSDEVLETGGMIRIIAVQNGDTLTTAPFREMAVFFPNKGTLKPGMQPFLGVANEDGGIDWKTDPSTRTVVNSSVTNSMNQLPVKSFGSERFIETNVSYDLELLQPNTETGELPIEWKLKDSVGTLDSWLAAKGKRTDRRLTLIPRGPEGVRVDLTFDRDGKVETINSTRLVDQTVLDALFSILRESPRIDMSDKEVGASYSVRFRGTEYIDRSAGERLFEKKYNDFSKGIIAQIPNAELNYYILSVSQLGWVNCDRFSRDTREKIAFTVQGDKDVEVFVVFTNINAQMGQIIQQDATTFYNLPIGEPVKIITVAQGKDGLKLSTTRTTVGRIFYHPAPGKTASLEELKQAFISTAAR